MCAEHPSLARALAVWRTRLEAEDMVAPDGTATLRARVDRYEAGLALVRAVAAVDPSHAGSLARADTVTEEDPEPPRALVERLLVRATVLDATGQLGEAARVVAEAHAHPTTLDCRALLLVALLVRSRILVQKGDEAQASVVLLEGAALARDLDARRQEAKFLGNLGFLQGEHDGRSYEAYTRRALAIAREIDDIRLIAHSLCNLGGALSQQGRYDEARACYEEGLPIAEEVGAPESIALFHAGLGGIHAATGDFTQGITLYQRSLAYFSAVGDGFQVARQHLLIGKHLIAHGATEEARPYIEESLRLCAGEMHRNLAWQAHDQLARIFEADGDYRDALQQLRTSWVIRESQFEARTTERIRLLELHLEAERASRAAAVERERNAELQESLAQQRRLQAEIEALARTDVLTGLSNRRHLGDLVARELSYLKRKWRPLSVALVDLDAFKSINDRYGHDVGDQVLVEVGRRLCASLREHDLVGRWGGEEFCVVLLDTDLDAATLVIERLLERLRGTPVETRTGPLSITASVGLTTAAASDPTFGEMLRRADDALYAAKAGGRDRAVTRPPPA